MAKAILRALTPEAEAALGVSEVAIDGYPFRVGRESRFHLPAVYRAGEERRAGGVRPNNDVYLHDPGRVKFVSREHLQIEHPEAGRYVVRDRGSACGTMVGSVYVGGDREAGECDLVDGNTIAVGGPDSPYVFQFVLAQE